jgi:hypothetical protein
VNGNNGSTCVDSGNALTANTWYKLLISSSGPGSVTFRLAVNGGALSSPVTITTNLPTANAYMPVFTIQNQNGSTVARSLDLDYFEAIVQGITR